MTIRHLKVFISVYDHMSITHAAADMHMTQPVVTRTIKELESHYGTLLFDRINHRLYATNAGKQLYAHACSVVNAFDIKENDALKNADHFQLRIGSTNYLGSFLLPGIIKDFKAHFPNAGIRAVVANAADLRRALCENELDFAIAEDELVDSRLSNEVFFKDRLVLLLPKDHPFTQKSAVSIRDLQDMPFLMREPGSTCRPRLDEMLAHNGVSVEPVMESCSTQAILYAIRAGVGLSILPEYLARPWVRSGQISSLPIADEPMVRKNFIVWHKEKTLTPQIHESMILCHRAASRLQEQEYSPPNTPASL